MIDKSSSQLCLAVGGDILPIRVKYPQEAVWRGMAAAAIIPHLSVLRMLKQGFVQYLHPHQIERYSLQYAPAHYSKVRRLPVFYEYSAKRIPLGQPIENKKQTEGIPPVIPFLPSVDNPSPVHSKSAVAGMIFPV